MNISEAMKKEPNGSTNLNGSYDPDTFVLVAPFNGVVPQDDKITYIVFEPTSNLNTRLGVSEAGSCVLFSEENMRFLSMITQNGDLFGVGGMVLASLEGLPNVEYTPEYNAIVFGLDKVSYIPLISDITAEQNLISVLHDKSLHAHDREKKQYTRANGNVKHLSDQDVFSGNVFKQEEPISDDEDTSGSGGS